MLGFGRRRSDHPGIHLEILFPWSKASKANLFSGEKTTTRSHVQRLFLTDCSKDISEIFIFKLDKLIMIHFQKFVGIPFLHAPMVDKFTSECSFDTNISPSPFFLCIFVICLFGCWIEGRGSQKVRRISRLVFSKHVKLQYITVFWIYTCSQDIGIALPDVGIHFATAWAFRPQAMKVARFGPKVPSGKAWKKTARSLKTVNGATYS